MEELRVCFVGVGSIANRHIRNLRIICEEQCIGITVDAYRRKDAPAVGVNNVYTEINEIPEDYDAIFITNPTEMHLETLKAFHNKGKHFFIEKPVVSLNQVEEAKRFDLRADSVYYVACPLRYNAVIQWIKNNVDPASVLSVRSISSSYLPDWRPGQDYRSTYSAQRDMGGGVSIDLIHEWDYLTYLFGWPGKVLCMMGKKSDLEIDSEDYSIYIAEYPDKIIELHLDYFGRKAIRQIQLITKTDTIVGDLINNTVSSLMTGKKISFDEDRDCYQTRELKQYLHMIKEPTKGDSSFRHGIHVLELTQGM